MDYAQFCRHIQANYPRLHPELYELEDRFLASSLVEAVRGGRPAALRAAARQVHPDVYVLDFFQSEFCRELLEEIEHFEDWQSERRLVALRPNTMNRYGNILDTF